MLDANAKVESDKMRRYLANLYRRKRLVARVRAAAKVAAPSDALGRLAQDWPTEELVVAVERLGGEVSIPARRALAVELALRGKPIERTHPVLASVVSAQRPSDPPPWLLPIEARMARFALGFGGPAGSSQALARPADTHRIDANWLSAERWTEVTKDADRKPLVSAVASWGAESNGRIEARVFSLWGATGDHAGERILRALDLAALPSEGPAVIEPLAPEDALAHLFSAAHGGAYNPSANDAHARDIAWTSLRALAGVERDAPIEEVERVAMQCAFVQLRGTSFFFDVACDIGLAVTSANRERLAILCASDTD